MKGAMLTVKIEMWADVLCPHCGLAHQRMLKALAAFEHGDEVEWIHRSYVIVPPQSHGEVAPVGDVLERRYGMNALAAQASTRPIVEMAIAEGLEAFHVLDNVVGDTTMAHEFLAYATEKGANMAAWHRLFRAYFGQRRSLFDIDSLVELALEIGLNGGEASDAIASGRYRNKVQADIDAGRRRGIRGVPFTVINKAERGMTLSGTQTTATLVRAIRDVWYDDAAPTAGEQTVQGLDGEVCGSAGCATVPKVG